MVLADEHKPSPTAAGAKGNPCLISGFTEHFDQSTALLNADCIPRVIALRKWARRDGFHVNAPGIYLTNER